MKYRITVSTLLLCLAAAPAFAGHPRAVGVADGNLFYDKARVVEVKPLLEVVQVPVSQRECWTDEVEVPARAGNPDSGMVAGGIIGGVIGHKLGKHHRDGDIATVAGTIIGGALGRNMASRQVTPGYVSREHRCRVANKFYEEERIAGYQVTYRYRGRLFTREMDHEPGKFVRVRVMLEPLD